MSKAEQGKRNRANGYRFEIRIFNRVKKDAKYVIHSAGSYGLFDIVALTWDGRVRLITCKGNGYLSPQERRKLLDYIHFKQTKHEVIELHYYKNKRSIGRKILTKEFLNEKAR